jgi:hypothetical protein
MKQKSRRTSDFAAALGTVAIVLGVWIAVYREGFAILIWTLFILGLLSLFISLWSYIHAKGYNPAWALSFFLVGPLVFLWFLLLPDRRTRGEASIRTGSNKHDPTDSKTKGE